MLLSKAWIPVGALVSVVACGATSHDERAGVHADPVVSSTPTDTPSCPNGTRLFCEFSNIDEAGGGPKAVDACDPVIKFTFDAGRTSFTWNSPTGQLVDAVVVTSASGGGTVYAYDPAVSSDGTALVADAAKPPLDDIRVCTKAASGDVDAGHEEEPSGDDDGGSKSW
jgi:hypothetical protein